MRNDNVGLSYADISRLSGTRLFIARAIWLILVSLGVLLFIVAFPKHFSRLSDEPFGFAEALAQLNLPPDFFATYGAGADLFAALICVTIGSIIFSRRSDDSVAILISLALCMLILSPLPVTAVLYQDALLRPFIAGLRSLAAMIVVTVFFIFPNGRFVPRWTRWFSLGLFLFTMSYVFVFDVTPPSTLLDMRTPSDLWFFFGAGLVFSVGVLAQVYRYHRISTAIERQQTKWVVAGLMLLVVCFVLVIVPLLLVPELRERGSASLVYILIGISIILIGVLALPLSIGFSVLHYHLWDIDILIRRTVTYSILSAVLLTLYFSGVVLLQQIFRNLTGQESDLAIIISTLAIAALFNPLRHRVQDAIDHRFYRRKYDAEKVLARFAQTVRDEVELEKLTGELLNVVNETMQPASVSLWLKKTTDNGEMR